MKNKKVTSHRPSKKTAGSSRTKGSKSNVERKSSSHSLQKKESGASQSGFSEPGNQRLSDINFDADTIGVP